MKYTDEEQAKHHQQTLLSLADEFFIQYLLGAHAQLNKTLILSRLFIMGHSIELYAKAALINQNDVPPTSHDVPKLLQRLDDSLCLSTEEIKACQSFFSRYLPNYDLNIFHQYRDAMELYQAEYYLMDLKYYIARDSAIIFPVRVSLQPVNFRYLDLVRRLRSGLKFKDQHHDDELVQAAEVIGFPENLGYKVI